MARALQFAFKRVKEQQTLHLMARALQFPFKRAALKQSIVSFTVYSTQGRAHPSCRSRTRQGRKYGMPVTVSRTLQHRFAVREHPYLAIITRLGDTLVKKRAHCVAIALCKSLPCGVRTLVVASSSPRRRQASISPVSPAMTCTPVIGIMGQGIDV
eukprot:2070151-Pleurochrysis_carterae.AAC.3